MKKFLLIFFVLNLSAAAQKSETDSVNTGGCFLSKKTLSVIALSAGLGASLISSYVAWWKDDSRSFRFYSGHWVNDPGLNGIDKVGHFYTSYLFYRLQRDLLMWGGYSGDFSTLTSAILTFSFAVGIEIGDAFSPYGFDYQDLTFNIGGLGYGFLQDKIPLLQNFKFKWSYIPRGSFSFPPKFTTHYDDHIYWFTINLHGLFGASFGKYWPELIQPALGFSVENLGNRREFIFGLDFNLLPLFNHKDENWDFAGKFVDMFHIPAPGIKYSPDAGPLYRVFLTH
ncbi:MAG TPA: DUF2279 domain-containing protein [Ignavibacteriaceae bacterium]|nr:DUF2279 domain-containing protein [Ignavibacteriaceae bacterium]